MQRVLSRIDMVHPENRMCVLIGHPVGHSLSPVIHSAAYRELDLDWHYAVMDVLESDLDAVLGTIDGDRLVGANVTIPYKQAVFERVDVLTDTAQAVGAVNTLYRRNGQLVGHNTDVAGFIQPLGELSGRRWTDERALVLGAGGAARAVAHALTRVLKLKNVAVTARREATARAIPGVSVVDWNERARAAADVDLIVNTTPVGMAPNGDASPLPDDLGFSTNQIVYDLIYAPERTRLLDAAAAHGATIIGGLPMLIGQAAEAFRIWTGRDMPVETVKKALMAHQAASGNS
jgi:shikimate dehydrogenase